MKNSTNLRNSWALIRAIARAFHELGAPAHDLEEALLSFAARRALGLQVHATPTSLLMTFDEGEEQRVHVMRLPPGRIDLTRSAQLRDLLEALECGAVTEVEALRQLSGWEPSQPYGKALRIACLAMLGAFAALFLGGRGPEMLVSGLIGGLCGVLAEAQARRPELARVFVPSAAFLAGFVSMVLLGLWGWGSVIVSAAGGLFFLLPGYTLTTALAEIANGHLSAGSARLARAGSDFLSLAIGVALGQQCAGAFVKAPMLSLASGSWALLEGPGVVLSGLAMGVLFKARRRDLVWVAGAATLAYLSAILGSKILGQGVGALLAAFVVTLAANAVERSWNRPAALILVPGILMLVPGSIGFRSLAALMARDVTVGVETGVAMFAVAAYLVAGLLFANLMLPARRSEMTLKGSCGAHSGS